MTQVVPRPLVVAGPIGSRRRWLDAELSSGWCVVGWIAATVLFVVLTTLSGGPGRIDARESVYSTWAIAHGEFNCAFPAVTVPHEPLIAPVYPLVSGAVAAVAGIGHAVPFPPHAALGPRCDGADAVIAHWALQADASGPTRAIGYAAWLFLLAGLVAWLRSAGRGRRRWEPVTLAAVAALPLVWSCVGHYLHPQDVCALGLGLAAMACARRHRWAAAGALIALAVLSQQFALLIAAPLMVLAPAGRKGRFVGAAAATAMCVVAPLFILSGGTVLRAITLGSGDNPSIGGTVMWHLSHHGVPMVLVSRVLPIVLALAVSWWAVRRFGPDARSSATVMMSLVAVSLSVRLVLEQNLFEYYFMALAVTLLLLDVTMGRIRGSVLTWLATVLMTFSLDGYFLRVESGRSLQDIVPPLVIVVALCLAAAGLRRGRRWPPLNVVLWSCLVVCALVTWRDGNLPLLALPTWFLQVVFVGTGAALAATPLLDEVRTTRPNRDGGPWPQAVSRPSGVSG